MAPKRSRSGSDHDELLAAPARDHVDVAQRAPPRPAANSRSARSPASWPWVSLSCLNRSRSPIASAKGRLLRSSERICSSALRRLTRPVSAVGRSLQLGLLEGAHGADARACLGGQRRSRSDALGGRPLAVGAGRVQHAQRAAHEADRHAHGRAAPSGAAAQMRARVEVLARLEGDRASAPHSHARERRADRAAGRLDAVVGGDAARGSRGSSPRAGAPSASESDDLAIACSTTSQTSRFLVGHLERLGELAWRSRRGCAFSRQLRSSRTRSVMSRAFSTTPRR